MCLSASYIPSAGEGSQCSLCPCPHLPSAFRPDSRGRSYLLHSLDQCASRANCRRVPGPIIFPARWVWLSSRDLPLHVASSKLAPLFLVSFPVTEVINPVAVRLRLPRTWRIHPSFHVSHLKMAVVSYLIPAPSSPSSSRHRRFPCLHCQMTVGCSPMWLREAVSGQLGRVWAQGTILGSVLGHPRPYSDQTTTVNNLPGPSGAAVGYYLSP